MPQEMRLPASVCRREKPNKNTDIQLEIKVYEMQYSAFGKLYDKKKNKF